MARTLSARLRRMVQSVTTTAPLQETRRQRAREQLIAADLAGDERKVIVQLLSDHVRAYVRPWTARRVCKWGLCLCQATVLFSVALVHRSEAVCCVGFDGRSLLAIVLVAAFAWTFTDCNGVANCSYAVTALGALRDTSAVPALAAALNRHLLRDDAAAALGTLATLLSDADEGRFSPSVESDLCLVLRHADDVQFKEIASVLSHVGGAHSLPAVEQLAEHGGSANKRRLARELLPILRERADRNTKSSLLLRPAHRTPDALLRSATQAPLSENGLLLRACEEAADA